jgi:hypothetical protein
VPKVTKAFLRQRFQASQNSLLNTCSLHAASAATPLAAGTMADAATATAAAAAAAAASSGSYTSSESSSDSPINGQGQDAGDIAATMLLPSSSIAGHPAVTNLCSATAPTTAAAAPDAARKLPQSTASATTNLLQPGARLSCKPSFLPAAFSKLKIVVPNPPPAAAAVSFLDGPITLIFTPGNTSAAYSDGAASNASIFKMMLMHSSIPGGQLYPPGVAAPAELGWGEATSACSPGSSCKHSGSGAASTLANKPLPASDHVSVTILHSQAQQAEAAAAQQREDDEALISLALLLDGDRVRAVITALQPSPAPSSNTSPASTIASRLKPSPWLAAGADAGAARDPVLAAAAMYGALRDSFEDYYPHCPCPGHSPARKRWQAAGAAVVFQRYFRSIPCLQDEAAMQAELLAAVVLGPSSMMELWRDSAPPSGQQQQTQRAAFSRAAAAAADTAVKAAGSTSTHGLIPAAYAGVEMAGSVAHVHLELDSSMFGLLSGIAGEIACGLDHSGRTSVQSPIPTGPLIIPVLDSVQATLPAHTTAAVAATTVAAPTASSSSCCCSSDSGGKHSTGRRGFFRALLNRKARKQVGGRYYLAMFAPERHGIHAHQSYSTRLMLLM